MTRSTTEIRSPSLTNPVKDTELPIRKNVPNDAELSKDASDKMFKELPDATQLNTESQLPIHASPRRLIELPRASPLNTGVGPPVAKIGGLRQDYTWR